VRPQAGISIVCLYTSLFATWAPSSLQAQSSVPAAPQASGSSSVQDSANDLVVAVGKSVLVDCARPVERVAIGSADLAEATAVSPTEIMINGKAAGETTLIVWQTGGGRQFFNVKIRASNPAANDRLEALRRELRTEFPGQPLRASQEGTSVFLRGTVKDLESSDRAVEIASTAGKVVNLLYVNIPPAEPQILLKVRFASLDRTLGRQLGINIFSTGAANTIGSVTTQQFSPATLANQNGTDPSRFNLSNLLNIFLFRPDIDLGATIQALESNNVLQILAEPNLLVANGKQGSFLAGGEYPYPVVQGSSGVGGTAAITVQFKEFGVRLNFIPTITPRGTIRLQVAPEVSNLDFANGLTISGFTVPSLDTRKVKTEVELSQGQSFAIGGLLDNRETKILSKIPFIGDVPVLGKLFQSISKTRSNTELMVIVTPEIVAPIPVGAPLPEIKFPGEFLPPNSGTAMLSPGADVTGAKPIPPGSPTMPVEQLIQSMRSEQPLVINSMSPGVIYAAPSAGAGAGVTSSGPK
jgi:pilus assembly protein CpaC